MGLDRTVTFPGGNIPGWPAVRALLASRGFAVQMGMIDGELAFPDEEPAATWHELRLGTPHGVVTIRREDDRLHFIVWGNADAGLLRAQNTLADTFAEAGGANSAENQP